MKWNRRRARWLMHYFTIASCSTPSMLFLLTIAKWISQRTSEISHRHWPIEMPFVLIYALFAHSNHNCKFSLVICCARAHIVSINADTVKFFLAPWIHYSHMKSEVFSIFLMPHSSSILFSSFSLPRLCSSVCACLHILFLLLSVLFFFICFHNDLLRNLSQNGAAPTCLHRNTLRPISKHTHDRSAESKAKNTSKIVLTIANGFGFRLVLGVLIWWHKTAVDRKRTE